MDFTLTDREREWVERGKALAKEFAPRAAIWDEESRYPAENHERLQELGLLGIALPTEFGGGGASLTECYLLVEEISKACANTALLVHDQNVSGRILATHGGPAHRDILERLARGEIEVTIAMTEPEAGSALYEMTTSVRRDGDEWVVNGGKTYNSFGDRAAAHLVYARFADTTGPDAIGMILVEADRPGVSFTMMPRKMGMHGVEEVNLKFDNVRVPAENVVIEGIEGSSAGFVRPLDIYNATRVGMGVMALGIAQGAMDYAIEHLRTRRQFGRFLGEFQGLQWMLADCAIQIEGARLLCYRALSEVDAGRTSAYHSACAKVAATEGAFKVVDDCLQMLGGAGYFSGAPLERMMRDVRMFKITGGTTQILKNTIGKALIGSLR
ncbi:MAG TPA: acyl-CoA dehydrogenase family protein [Pseudonocardia sp.]